MSITPQLSYEAVFFGFDSELDLSKFADLEDLLKLADKITLRLGEDRAEAVEMFKQLEDYLTACEKAYDIDQLVPIDIQIANAGGYTSSQVVENLVEGDISFFLPKTLQFESRVPTPFVNHEDAGFILSREVIIQINKKVEARSVWSFRLNHVNNFTQTIELEEGTKQISHGRLYAEDDDGILHPIAYRCRKRSRVMGRSIFIMFKRYIDEESKNMGIHKCWADHIEYNGFEIDIYSSKREFDEIYIGWQNWNKVVANVYDNERLIFSEEKYFDFPSWHKKKNHEAILADFNQRVVVEWIDKELIPEYRDMPGTYHLDVEVYVKTIPFKKAIAPSNRRYRKFVKDTNKKKIPRKYDSVIHMPPAGAYTHEQYKENRKTSKAKLRWVIPKSHWIESPYQVDDI
jgi:hypothetical protein